MPSRRTSGAIWPVCCRRISYLGVALFVILLLTPGAVLAQATSEEGCSCHSAETEAWQQSPHGQTVGSDDLPAATCEGCHGPYVRGHPDDGIMNLTADSSACTECHTGTFGQWEGSRHAQAGVQCIGCHLSHSQTLRMDDQSLCLSCHREDAADEFHLSHRLSDVECTSCHLAPDTHAQITTGSTGETLVTIPAPVHDFVTVAAANCVDCHSEDVRAELANGTTYTPQNNGLNQMTAVELVAEADRVPALESELDAAQSTNRALIATCLTALGLGMGIGAVMGIILVLAIGYVTQRRTVA